MAKSQSAVDAPPPALQSLEGLRQSLLFQGFDERVLKRIVAHLRTVTVKAGATLFLQDDPPDGCYIIEEGTVTVSVLTQGGEENLLAVLGSGDVVGEMGLLDDQPRSASVSALKPCVLSFLPRAEFHRLADDNPSIYRHMLKLVCSRLRATNANYTSRQILPLGGRLAGVLIRLADGFGQPIEGGDRTLIHHAFTQEVLARMAGGARENVSRQLSTWRKAGVISKVSRYYCIEDMSALRDATQPGQAGEQD